jgi:hypothetical protein
MDIQTVREINKGTNLELDVLIKVRHNENHNQKREGRKTENKVKMKRRHEAGNEEIKKRNGAE